MTTCTWKDCQAPATTPQTDKDGKEWSCLCDAHAMELDEAIFDGPKAMLRTWVLAMGGAEVAAGRFGDAVAVGRRALAALAPTSKIDPKDVFAGVLRRFEDGR